MCDMDNYWYICEQMHVEIDDLKSWTWFEPIAELTIIEIIDDV